MGNYYIQEVERIAPGSEDDSKVSILPLGSKPDLRSFKSLKELDDFANRLGFTYEPAVTDTTDVCGVVNTYNMGSFVNDIPTYFWSLEELPTGAKKVVLTENGEDVICYFTHTDKAVNIFRPNSNAKEVYRLY